MFPTQPECIELVVPARTKWFHIACGTFLQFPALGFFLFQWNDTVAATVILILYCSGFSALMVQGIQSRVRLSHDFIQKRYLGLWRTKVLPASVSFAPVHDLSSEDALARKLLGAPPAIGIFDDSTGREVARISYEFFAGAEFEIYDQVLERLNHDWRKNGTRHRTS